jgi:glutathione S-transferase
MIELYQFPWSPYCIVQRRILEFARVPFHIIDIAPSDRSRIWRLTRERYYAVPVLRDGRTVLFETDEYSQVLAKYLDAKLGLGLFPRRWDGIQDLLWRYFESEIEGAGFKLNDLFYREFMPKSEWLPFIRHKERKFGHGCLEQWQAHRDDLLATLEDRLCLCEEMLGTRPFLLDEQPRFVDFDLYGMLANFLYSGHYELPARSNRLREWYQQISQIERPRG